MTMVPSPKLSKPLHFFYGGCGGGGSGGGGSGSGVMTRFSDGYGGGYNNIGDNITTTTTSSANNNCHNNNIVMADEEQEQHSRNSNTSVNDDDDEDDDGGGGGGGGDQLLSVAVAAAPSATVNGRSNTPTPPYGGGSNWLQLGLGGITHDQQNPTRDCGGGGGGGLMLELNLGGSSESRVPPPPQPPPPQRLHHFGNSIFFGSSSATTVFLSPPHHHHHHHHQIPPNPNPNPQPYPYPYPQPLLLSGEDNQIGWGFRNQTAVVGCSSSLSPSSSSSMPPGQGSFLTRPGTFTPSGSSMDSEFRLIHPPPRRPHSGIWFTLQASLHQSKEPFLPQVSKSFLRIKDGRMTIRLVMKYLANKLGLDSESEVEIRCRGQQLVPFLTLQHVRDNIWSPREGAVTLLPDSSTSHHLMLLNYGRSSSTST